MNPRAIWTLLREATRDFVRDEVMTWSASIAFYAALSLAPVLLILIWVGGLLGEDAKAQLVEQIVRFTGEEAGAGVQAIVESASNGALSSRWAGVIGIGALVFTATTVFAQLQIALNRVWNVRAHPERSGIWPWLRKRLLSLGMVLGVIGLLLTSLVLDAATGLLSQAGVDEAPGGSAMLAASDDLISLVVFVLLFAALFKLLPDVEIQWRDVWVGAAVTGVLVLAGKLLLGLYLTHMAIGSAYGAAGSLLVLLVWIYYTTLVALFGAEVTQVWAREHGTAIEPDRHAIWDAERRLREKQEKFEELERRLRERGVEPPR